MRMVASKYGFLITLIISGSTGQIDTKPQNVAGISGISRGVRDTRTVDVESQPTCFRDKEVYKDGEIATISCEVRFSGPWGPEMTLIGPGEKQNNSKAKLVKWSVKLEVNPENNGETFTCETKYGAPSHSGPGDATNEPILSLNDCTKTIFVNYAPRNTTIAQETAFVGDTLTCVSNANPAVEESGFVWTVGNENSTGSTFKLEDRHQGELNISCCATNTMGGPDCDEKQSMLIYNKTLFTSLIVGGVPTSLVVIAIVVGIFVIGWRRRSGKPGKPPRENINLHPQFALPGMVGESAERPFQNSVNLSDESVYNKLEQSRDDLQGTNHLYARMRRPTNQLEIDYEEVTIGGCECTADAVKPHTLLHSGNFCDVYTGIIIKKLKGCPSGTRVVFKRNKGSTTALEQSMLLGEIKALQTVGRHPNIVQLLAQCVLKDPVMSVCALATHGDLKNYLKELRSQLFANTNLQQTFIGIIQDVASGMSYLSGIKPGVIHRRLAPEHVLVSERHVCKVIGFGFAEQILDREKYERIREIEPEVRWMAPEQLTLTDHSLKSDVWAFGVLMWEVFSCGEIPYAGLSTLEVKQLILSGGALGMPKGTRGDVFEVMLKCWDMEEHKRPSFHKLREVLRSIRYRSD